MQPVITDLPSAFDQTNKHEYRLLKKQDFRSCNIQKVIEYRTRKSEMPNQTSDCLPVPNNVLTKESLHTPTNWHIREDSTSAIIENVE